MINKTLKTNIHNFYNSLSVPKKNNVDQNIKYVKIPYVPQLSEKLNNILKPYNIRVAHQNTNNLKFAYTQLKDKIPKNQQTHVVYKIPCNNCEEVYIGQTQQHLKERLKGHKYQNNLTALKKHQLNTGHRFDFDNTSILNKEINYRARNVLEMIQINKHPNAVNDKIETEGLSKIYHSIL